MNRAKSNKYIWLLGLFGLFAPVPMEAMQRAYELSKRIPRLQRSSEVRSNTMLQKITAAFNRFFYPSSEMLTTQKRFEARNKMLRGLRQKALLAENVVELKKEKPVCTPDEYPVVDKNGSISVCLSRDELKLSKTLDTMVSDIDPEQLITPKPSLAVLFPMDVIEDAFGVLKTYQKNLDKEKKIRGELIRQEINFYTMDRFVPMFNCAHYLAFDQSIQNIFSRKLEQDIKSSNGTILSAEVFKQLNPDLQKLLMLTPVTHCLEDIIRQTYASKRKRLLANGLMHKKVRSAEYNPDGTMFAAAVWDSDNSSQLGFWNADGRGVVKASSAIISIAFSSDGKLMVSAGKRDAGGFLEVWNTLTKDCLHSFDFPSIITSAVFMPGSNRAALGGQDGTIMIVDALMGHQLMGFKEHAQALLSLVASPDGKKILSGGQGQDALGWNDFHDVDWDKPDVRDIIGINLNVLSNKNVNSVMFSHDGSKFVVGSGNGIVVLYRVVYRDNGIDGQATQLRFDPSRPVYSVAFSHDDKKVLVGYKGTTSNVEILDISDLDNITTQVFTGIPNNVYSARFSPDDRKILVGGLGGRDTISDILIEWTLLTSEEKLTLDKLQNCNAAQLRLIYQCALLKSAGKFVPTLQIDSPEYALFMTLLPEIQTLLTDLFWPKGTGLLSGW